MDIISFSEAKKASKKVGDLVDLLTNNKDCTVDAINELKIAFNKLLPAQPPNLSTKTLTMEGVEAYLANGVEDNTGGSMPIPTSKVTASKTTTPSSVTITGFGAGTSGTLNALLNGVVVGSRTLHDVGDVTDVGIFECLQIISESDYPISTPGFWQSLSAKFLADTSERVPMGYNKIQLTHSETGSTDVAHYVRDTITEMPLVTDLSVTLGSYVNYVYTSGIKQLGGGTNLLITAKVKGIISRVYSYSPVDISGSGISTLSLTLSDLGISPNKGVEANVSKEVTILAGLANGIGTYTVSAKHPFIPPRSMSSSNDILLYTGGGISEARRTTMGNGDYVDSSSSPNFNSTLAVNSWDAKIVGGVLKYDSTDYRSCIPSSVNYSSHTGTYQYATFVMNLYRSSNALITVSGGGGLFDKCWIKLPGKTGWLDTQIQYYLTDGTPTANGAGIKTNGSKSSCNVTFGTNSTGECGDIVLIRFKLTSGQSITSFTVAPGGGGL